MLLCLIESQWLSWGRVTSSHSNTYTFVKQVYEQPREALRRQTLILSFLHLLDLRSVWHPVKKNQSSRHRHMQISSLMLVIKREARVNKTNAELMWNCFIGPLCVNYDAVVSASSSGPGFSSLSERLITLSPCINHRSLFCQNMSQNNAVGVCLALLLHLKLAVV